MLAAACLGVPFIAGAKLLDSVRPVPKRRRPGEAKEIAAAPYSAAAAQS